MTHPSQVPKSVRNGVIYQSFLLGRSSRQIARDYGISATRVLQIVHRAKRQVEGVLPDICDVCGHTAYEHRDRNYDSEPAPCGRCGCPDFEHED